MHIEQIIAKADLISGKLDMIATKLDEIAYKIAQITVVITQLNLLFPVDTKKAPHTGVNPDLYSEPHAGH